MTPYVYHDGGRAAAGFKGDAGDCVVRAIAIASAGAYPYAYVYDEMARLNATVRLTRKRKGSVAGKRSARNGVFTHTKAFKDWMTAHGFRWVPTMGIGTGCKVHLRADELPGGRLVTMLSRHAAAVIDGVLHDTYDCSRDGTRCVYGYWVLD